MRTRSRPDRHNPAARERRARGLLPLGALVGSVAVAQCAEPPTRILVVVDSNVPVPDEIDRFFARACIDRSPAGTPVLRAGCDPEQPYVELRHDLDRPLPLSFAVTQEPGTAADARILVEVSANLGDEPKLLRRARVRFTPRQISVLPMFLDRYCTFVNCAPGSECNQVQPMCADNPGELPPIGALRPGQEFDAAVFDAAAPDGDQPDGEQPDASPPSDGPLDAPETSVEAGPDTRDAPDGGPLPDVRDEPVTPPDSGVEACNPSCTGCVYTQRDPDNCGRCGMRCEGAPNAYPACTNGRCGIACAPGFADCDPAVPGCETNIGNDSSNCGRCGVACVAVGAPAGARSYCDRDPTAPRCRLECPSGFALDETDGTSCVQAPVQLSPPSGSVLTTNRPTLRWDNRTGIAALSLALCAGAPSCARNASPTGSSYQPAMPMAPGTYFWRIGTDAGSSFRYSPWWSFHVPERTTAPTTGDPPIAGTRFDMNGDGRTDVLIGAPTSGNVERFPTVSPDRVYGFLGAADRITRAAPDGALVAPVSVVGFGARVTAAGDLNGDGFADAVTPSFANDLFVINGRAGALPRTYSSRVTVSGVEGAPRIAAAGDLDLDGYSDLIVWVDTPPSLQIYRGGAQGISVGRTIALSGVPADFIVSTLVGGFDANGDGRPDLAASESTTPRILVWLSTSRTVDPTTVPVTLTLNVPSAGESFSEIRALAAGDLDGDGCAELVGGSPFGGDDDAGRVAIWSGARTNAYSAAPVVLGPGTMGAGGGTRFGAKVSAAGDINGDNLPDLVVTSVGTGLVFAYAGVTTSTSAPFAILRGPPEATDFGIEFAPVVGLDAPMSSMLVVAHGFGQPMSLLRSAGTSGGLSIVGSWPAPDFDGRPAHNYGQSITR